MSESTERAQNRTALLLLAGTAVAVLGALAVLHFMQPLVLRGVAVPKAYRSARTHLTVRATQAPAEVLAEASPNPGGCFEIPLQDVSGPGELMLHAKRGRISAVISPVGPRAITEFVITQDKTTRPPRLLLKAADAETRKKYAACFRR